MIRTLGRQIGRKSTSKGHTITVELDEDAPVMLTLVCHEPDGAWCRLYCPELCESWSEGHEHELIDNGKCNAVEWQEGYGILENHIGRQPISDGQPIDVWWDYDAWLWGVKP